MKCLTATSLVLAVACGPSSSSRDGSAGVPPPPSTPAGGGSTSPGGGGTAPDAGSPPAPAPDPGPAPDAGSGGSSAPVPQRLTTGETGGGNIALDDRNVYWAHYENAGGWKHWHYTVRGVAKTGGAAFTLAEGAGDMLSNIVAQGGFVYWVMATCPQDCDRFDFKLYIYRVPRSGGAVQELRVEADPGQ